MLNIVNDLEKRSKLAKMVDEAVYIHNAIKESQDDLKSIANTAKDDLGISPAQFSALVKASLDLDKANEKYEEAGAVLDAIELIKEVG